MIPYLIVFLGLILILFEFYVPGAVLGIMGGITVLIGIILFISESNSLISIILFVLGSAVSVGFLIRFAIWRIVHAKPENSIYLSTDQEGYQASSYDHTAIGKIGIVLTDLKPGGFILIEGQQQAAISISGYILKGEQVEVIGGQEQSLMVKALVTPLNQH